MMNERERTLEEREQDICSIEEEMLDIERGNPNYEDSDSWNALYHELTCSSVSRALFRRRLTRSGAVWTAR